MNTKLRIFLLFFSLSSPCILMSMDQPSDYPQLQLLQPKKQWHKAELMLTSTAVYLPNSFHNNRKDECFQFGLSAQHPYVAVSLIISQDDFPSKPKIIKTIVPAKILFACNDNSCIDLAFSSNGKEYLLKAICTKNSAISDKSFKKQFSTIMKNFYRRGAQDTFEIFAISSQQECIDELIKDAVIYEVSPLTSHIFPSGTIIIPIPVYVHNNGCSTKETFIKLIMEKNIKPYGGVLNYVMGRQTGKAFPQLQVKK